MEQTQDGEVVDKETEKASDMEAAIRRSMRVRVGHFKAQADSLTLEGVRRLLEKDLKLERFALDVHKRFIKKCLEECFDGADDENSKTSGENVEEVHSDEKSTTKSLEGLQPKKEAEPNTEDEKKDGSPVLGLLREEEENQHEETQSAVEKVPSEGTIKKAIKKRAAYFRENSEEVTLVGARRLLEEDLGLDKYVLDSYKKFISDQLDEVLHGPEAAQSPNGIKKKPNKDSRNKGPKKVSKPRTSDSSDSEDEEVGDDDIKPKKQKTPKGKSANSEMVKSRKSPAPETKSSSNKRKKPVEPTSDSDEKDGNLSENSHSQSTADEPVKKKKEVSTHAYGKQVEHLKSIIKACGMSVTPSVYKKVKQAPENKRESYLIKELQDILGKEGLSTNPSEKEIKAVKKNKERIKELEGIDMSNIVSSSRRRSTTTYVAPPKPKIPVESDGNDDKKNDDEDGTNDDEDDDDDDDEDDSSSEGASEGFDEDVDDEND